MSDVKPVPDGFTRLSPHIVLPDPMAAMDFYQKVFGAQPGLVMKMPGTEMVMHAEMKFGDTMLMISGEFPDMGVQGPAAIGGSPVTMHLYNEDVDAVVQKATEAGAEVTMPPMDMFWGDRYCKLKDPWGHSWSVATHIADPTEEEMMQAMAAMMSGDGPC